MARMMAAAMRVIGCGVLLGVMARIVMHVIAIEADVPRGFSIGGSLEVIAFGAMIGTPAAAAFTAFRAHVAKWRPLLGGVAGLLLFAPLAAAPPPAAVSAMRDTPDTPLVTAAVFCAMFVLWGILVDLTIRELDATPLSCWRSAPPH